MFKQLRRRSKHRVHQSSEVHESSDTSGDSGCTRPRQAHRALQGRIRGRHQFELGKGGPKEGGSSIFQNDIVVDRLLKVRNRKQLREMFRTNARDFWSKRRGAHTGRISLHSSAESRHRRSSEGHHRIRTMRYYVRKQHGVVIITVVIVVICYHYYYY